MGCLIVLLLMVVQQARIGAKAAAAEVAARQSAENTQRSEEVEQETDDLRLRREQLAQQIAEMQEMLANKRLEMSAVEEHIRKIEDEVARLQAIGKELIARSKSKNSVVTADQAQLDALRTKLDQKKKELEEARKLAGKRKPEFSIVPYEGANGTNRRPIFVECRIDGVVLQPEEIVLSPNDFQGPMGPGNPLDAALRAVREQMKENGLEGEPYPLIVVRPDGAVAYLKAREAMKHWENEFGYELVEDDVELKFPKPDPAMAMIVNRALKDARERQTAMIAAMPKRFGGPTADSFEIEPYQTGGGDGEGGNGPGGSGSGTGRQNSVSRPAGSKVGTSGTGGSGPGGVARTNYAGGVSASSNAVAASAYGSAASKLRASQLGPGGMGTGTGGALGGTGSPGATQNGTAGHANGGNGTGGNGTSTTPGSKAGSAGKTAGSMATAGKGATGQPGSSGSGASKPGATTGSGSGAAGDPNVTGSASIAGMKGMSGGSSAGTSGASGASGTASGGSPSAAENASQPNSLQSASLEYRPDVDKAKATSSRLTRQKGDGWGVKGTGASPGGGGGTRMSEHATAVARPITVRCSRTQVVVIPDRDDTRRASVVELPGDLATNVDPLITAVRKRIDFWGQPVEGCYWKPVLSVDVAPDAEERYQELTALLQGSGVDVQRKVKR